MSFLRHLEIYPSDGGASRKADAPAHRLDEFLAGYSLAGWSPPEPASASPAGPQYAVQSSCRSRDSQRTANSVLTVCVSPGGKPNYVLHVERLQLAVNPRCAPQRIGRSHPFKKLQTPASVRLLEFGCCGTLRRLWNHATAGRSDRLSGVPVFQNAPPPFCHSTGRESGPS